MLKNPLYQIYLLQLENYNLRRFIAAAVRDFFLPPKRLRNPIVFTKKLVGVTILAVLIGTVITFLLGSAAGTLLSPASVAGWFTVVTLLIVLYFCFFILLAVATLVVLPLDRLIRLVIQTRARQKIDRLDNITVIAITGSYGKTTMKQTLEKLLHGQRKIVATSESHNTPVSVARTILDEINEETDIFIVEMGAHHLGDIAKLCQVAPPDISILNGINEAHLERFGSLENTIHAKFEIVTSAPEASVILNADDETVMDNYENFVGDRTPHFYSAKNYDASDYTVYDQKFHEDGTGISFRVKKDGEQLGYTKVSHFGNYIIGYVIAGLCVGDALGLSGEEIIKNTHRISPADHRLQPIQRSSENVLVIDDSYNGNPAGAHAAIDVLEKFISRRTIYVTPGLVEMGDRVEAVHKEIGQHLAAVVDVVVLVETSVTGYIEEGLKKGGFAGELRNFASPQEMHDGISEVLKPRDVMLFQNDWPENYR